jgi:hypothetical protein
MLGSGELIASRKTAHLCLAYAHTEWENACDFVTQYAIMLMTMSASLVGGL